jgi:hypothetical protein
MVQREASASTTCRAGNTIATKAIAVPTISMPLTAHRLSLSSAHKPRGERPRMAGSLHGVVRRGMPTDESHGAAPHASFRQEAELPSPQTPVSPTHWERSAQSVQATPYWSPSEKVSRAALAMRVAPSPETGAV